MKSKPAQPSNQMIICIYHDDADGRCSAAIVRRALGSSVLLLAMDYGDPAPWELIDKAQKVVIVDFSLPMEDMLRIRSQTELIWIDHHKTSIESLVALEEVAGLRNATEAACVLTWKTFFNYQPVPVAVAYIGDRDLWRFAFPESAPFGEGLQLEDTNPTNDALWEPLLASDEHRIAEFIQQGRLLYRAKQIRIERNVARMGVEVEFEGYRTLAVNMRGSGDIGQHVRDLGYEVGYCFYESQQNGKWKTFVTLYSDHVDVSVIARKFGGGGHPGAAGFSFERSDAPFPARHERRA